jgi:hypothetical protein
MSNRLSLLEEFLKEDPKDPFNWYALALEWASIDKERSCSYFEHLREFFPNYLPFYLVYAQIKENNKDFNDAVSLYKKGIEIAKMQQNDKALLELKNALYNLELEID